MPNYVKCSLYIGTDDEKYNLQTLKKMWDKFSDIPVNNDDEIEEDFELWEAGTNKYDIWHWFDEHCPNGLVKDIINA